MTEAAQAIRSGKLTSRRLVEDCLARIDARDPQVRAWIALDPDRALREADAADRAMRDIGPARCGPLHGVPIGVKDVIDTADLPTCYGSPIYRNHRPKADAACVALARAAGAIVLGKTATAEFASIDPPATRNPVDLAYGPGGSSSGSAASVADRMVPLAFGTQTAGSTIRPAAYCGVIGYKPSFGLINRAGLKFSAESLDTIGLFARSVRDVAAFMQAVSGLALPASILGPEHDRIPPTRNHGDDGPAGRPWRIGVCRTSRWSLADACAQRALETAARRFTTAGASVFDIELPPALDAAYDAQAIIIRYEAARAMAWETSRHRSLYSATFAARIDEGLAIELQAWRDAMIVAEDCRQRFARACWHGAAQPDVLITPSATGVAPVGTAHTGDSIFNRIWTLLGVPCLHLPTGAGTHGLPIGVQIVGAFGADATTLACARWAEQVIAED